MHDTHLSISPFHSSQDNRKPVDLARNDGVKQYLQRTTGAVALVLFCCNYFPDVQGYRAAL